jgi:glycosyltransferase involved in cell wall biosynthesis
MNRPVVASITGTKVRTFAAAMAHVLICTPAFPASASDPDCAPAVMHLLNGLRERADVQLSVITTQYPFRSGSYTWNGIRVYACDGRNATWRKPLALLRGLRQASAFIREHDVRHVHAFWMGDAALVAHRAAKRHGLPCSVTLMGRDARDGNLWWSLLRGRNAPRVIALCERQATFFRRMSGRPPDSVLPFGLPDDPVSSTNGPRPYDVLFCGSMYAVKRPLLFLDVIRRIAAQRTVKALMLGQGPQERIRQAIATLPPNAEIELIGAVPRSEVLALMRASRVLLHTASYEGQCLAFDEAAASGMRIVSTATGSARPDPWWRIADDADGLAAYVLEQLDATAEAPLRILHPLGPTIDAYSRMFKGA